MKAERRHELKTNTLARGLEQLPEAGRQHGTKIMVALLLVLLALFFIRQRIATSRAREASAAYSLNSARGDLRQFDEAIEMGMFSPQALATLRQQVATRAEESVRNVLETADDPRLIAEAKLARGDLNWKLANFPDLPGAATQPSLQFPRSQKDLLQSAAQSYQEVLDDPGSPKETKWTARFGLAAVKENQGEWDQAKDQYQKLVNDLDVPQPLKDQAIERLNTMDARRHPVLLVAPVAEQPVPPTTGATTSTAPSTSTAPTSIAPSSTAPTSRSTTTTSPASKPASAPAASAPAPKK
jgi:tetratricopeptide (TPR) repeat protein